MSSQFIKLYTGYSIAMTTYGFSRGYRCDNAKLLNFGVENDTKTQNEKICGGVINSCLYLPPLLNFLQTWKMIKRLEISHKNLDKMNNTEEYKELVGFCYDTL